MVQILLKNQNGNIFNPLQANAMNISIGLLVLLDILFLDKSILVTVKTMYILIINNKGELYRLPKIYQIPIGFRKALKDEYGQSYYDESNNLKPKYWAIKRYR
jgi:hypothetical protein